MRISVITVSMNNLQGVRRTFSSLANQTYRDVEHIVVDGGSCDGTCEWIATHQVFERTVLISESDRGIFDAMNKGLHLATGEVIYYLNAGDCLASNEILEMVARSYLRAHWEWAVGSSQMVNESFVPTRRATKPAYSWLRKTFWQYDLSHQAVFMRTELLRTAGGFDEQYPVSADCHLATRVGRIHQPEELPGIIAFTLEGGASGTNMVATHWEFHRGRVDILKMTSLIAMADAVWTAILIVKTYARRFFRLHLRLHERLQTSSLTFDIPGSR